MYLRSTVCLCLRGCRSAAVCLCATVWPCVTVCLSTCVHALHSASGIDHWAALVVDGNEYQVLAVEGKEGSVLQDGGFSADRAGVPGIWVKDVVNGAVVRSLVPETGKLSELLRPASAITPDPRLQAARDANPDE